MDDHVLKTMLEEFEAAAKALQQSLLKRNVDNIWSAIDLQDQAANRLSEMVRGNVEAFRGILKSNPAIQRTLNRSQSLMRTNRAMATRFLDVMDKTLAQLGGNSAPARGYGYGGVRRSGPMLVRQMG